jgi:hypothetical protein
VSRWPASPLVKKLEKKPFALIGVNGNTDDVKKLKAVMDREKMNWRSFADKGTINATTPTYYVIDHKGVIRYKWVGSPGEKAIDSALEKTIHEDEKDSKKSPK